MSLMNPPKAYTATCSRCQRSYAKMRPHPPEWVCGVCLKEPVAEADSEFDELPPKQGKRAYGGGPLGAAKPLFTVYEARNGYMATLTDGTVVVGTTLSDVSTAAETEIATRKLQRDEEGPAKDATFTHRSTVSLGVLSNEAWCRLTSSLVDSAYRAANLPPPPPEPVSPNAFQQARAWLKIKVPRKR